MRDLSTKQHFYLTLWLRVMCGAIICMIFIGGLTRLTDSGLSITEWQPITGILPPLTEASWAREFDKYKQTPEYIQINNNINLAEFKSIFWLEFIHRIAGRITGILYIFPLIYFLLNKTISSKKIYIYITGLILLISQGFAGWYMVKSGLISAPCVSHFRLAIHLLLAIALYTLLFWQLMGASFDKIPTSSMKSDLVPLNIGLNICLILLFIQITFGAFVAGLDGGLVYNQFPLMGDSIIPNEITSGKFGLNSFYDPVFVQFIHRMLAYIVTIAILVTCLIGLKIQNLLLSKSLVYLIITLILQVMVGILTLIYLVPITLALFHQIGAVILLSNLLWAKYLAVN
ncbi:MAG: COX15/CtaA family protein [Rickettsiales bacterium]|nr:COX15/CtaA family protein [Rickettsiales bacterium]